MRQTRPPLTARPSWPLARAGAPLATILAAAIAVAGLPAAAWASPATPAGTAASPAAPATRAATAAMSPACPAVKPGQSRCFELRGTGTTATRGLRAAASPPQGYGPTDLRGAYALPDNGGAGTTVAIVDAYDDPNVEADLAVYRQQYGLPACTTANGCFRKVDQRGGTDYPGQDSNWAGEISLDADMVSAIAPQAQILLVEADSNNNPDLGAAVNEAVALGARYVSNSYGSEYDATPGSGEDPAMEALDPDYDHPGVAVVASTGDGAYGVAWPASTPYVTSVGGTSLVRDSGTARGWSETAWSGAGSGCSVYEPKPAFQTDTGCAHRADADVSAVADDNTPVAVYDSFDAGGWGIAGGTSVATPIIASVYADAGTPAPGTYPNSYPYLADRGGLNDVTSGSNGTCSPSYLCTAVPGYDGPTGLGSPNGLAAFRTGPHGHVVGTVTDTTGRPIAGASVGVPLSGTLTDAQGRYDLNVPTGTYTVTAADFGYASASVTGVAVTDGAQVTEDLTLSALPRATISGTVADGSGHGWPVYARVTVDGVPGGPVFTDPATGRFRLDLPDDQTYQLHVTPVYPGYQVADPSVTVAATDRTLDVSLPVDQAACDAPGYQAGPAGACVPVPGGLAFGQVVDANTGTGIANAAVTVAGAPAARATTVPTPDDPAIGDGFYWLFVPDAGRLALTGSKANYTPATSTARVAAGHATRVGFTLRAGRLTVGATSVDATVGWDGTATEKLTLKNTGTAPATVTLAEQPAAAGATTTTSAGGAPVRRVRGDYSDLASSGGSARPAAAKPGPGGHSPSAGQWTAIAGYPTPIEDNVAVAGTGTIYSAFGYDGSADTAALYSYDPGTGAWTQLASAADPRERPAAGFIGGRLYATGGWGAFHWLDPKTEIYDPNTDTWSTGAPEPIPYAASGAAVLGGKLYVVGGCTGISCGATDVQVYDPASDAWSAAAAYPEPIAWESCGAIGGKLYCAGGDDADGSGSTRTYRYDPATDSWSRLADLPIDLWGSSVTAAGGALLVSGGVTDDGTEVTNQGYALHPATGSWTALPNAGNAVFRGASACGLYQIGGNDGAAYQSPVPASEVLPGYADCADGTGPTWLSTSTTKVTVKPGRSATISVRFNARAAALTGPGTVRATLSLMTDTPYDTAALPVTMTVRPPRAGGRAHPGR